MVQNENELYHHGVKGMKWGRRKRIVQSASNKANQSAKKRYGRKATYYEKEKAADKALAADNKKRVNKYGADKVKASNAIRMTAVAAIGAAAVGIALSKIRKINAKDIVKKESLGAKLTDSKLKRMNKRSNTKKALVGVAAAATIVGLGKRFISGYKDYKLADQNAPKPKNQG